MKTLIMSEHAHRKLRAYIDQCEYEISGIGKLEVTPKGFYLVDVTILKQKVTGATTDIDIDALGAFAYELTKNGDDLKYWRCWFHSHANMSAFFSGTDTDTIAKSTDHDYMVSLVGNHAGEWRARYDNFVPIHATAELSVQVEHLLNKELQELCANQIKELVTNHESEWEKYEKYTPKAGYSLPMLEKQLAGQERKRLRKLLRKAGHQALTDEEAIELSLYHDMGDNSLSLMEADYPLQSRLLE